MSTNHTLCSIGLYVCTVLISSECGFGWIGEWVCELIYVSKCARVLSTHVLYAHKGAGIAQLVVLGLAVHSVAGSILLWGHFPVEGIIPLELTWVQTPFPQKLLRVRV